MREKTELGKYLRIDFQLTPEQPLKMKEYFFSPQIIFHSDAAPDTDGRISLHFLISFSKFLSN